MFKRTAANGMRAGSKRDGRKRPTTLLVFDAGEGPIRTFPAIRVYIFSCAYGADVFFV